MSVLFTAGGASAVDWQVGGNVGGGWLTAPSRDAKAEDLRPTFVLLGDVWLDKGRLGVGGELTLDLAGKTGRSWDGQSESETVALTSAVVMVGGWIPLDGVPARVRLAAGGGILHSWDELDRGGRLYQQESWGPEFHLAAIWERTVGHTGLIRLRLAGVNAWTVSSEIIGSGVRSSSDWSRVEFTAGWAFGG